MTKFIESNWHHTPPHRFRPGIPYMVTGATLWHQHFFETSAKLRKLEDLLPRTAKRGGWKLLEWAAFSNHWHFVGSCRDDGIPVGRLAQEFHSRSARWLNARERKPGRKVWYDFWETALTYDSSFYARMNYVHQNSVHHGLVALAGNYPFCSASRVVAPEDRVRHRRMLTYRFDRLKVSDAFEPIWIEED